MTPSLTPLEIELCEAILNSEYGDNATDAVWTECVTDGLPGPGRKWSGVVSSLVKKEVCRSSGAFRSEGGTIELTPLGVRAFVFATLGRVACSKLKNPTDMLFRD